MNHWIEIISFFYIQCALIALAYVAHRGWGKWREGMDRIEAEQRAIRCLLEASAERDRRRDAAPAPDSNPRPTPELKLEVDSELKPNPVPTPAAAALNEKRKQAFQMVRRGASAAEIAKALKLRRAEIDFLMKVNRMADLPVPADPARA